MRRCTALLTFFGLSALLFPVSALAAAPTHTLRLGDSGPDVLLLQQLLNTASDTQVATSGPGAPGQESTYFGAKTADAVRRFQWKYKDDILTPSQLVTPTGFVGSATLKKLESLMNGASAVSAVTTPSVATTTPLAQAAAPYRGQGIETLRNLYGAERIATSTLGFTPITPGMKTPPGVNPNMINFNYAAKLLRQVGKQQGLTDAQIARNESVLRDILSTTTDLSQEFFKRVQSGQASTVSESTLSGKIKEGVMALLTTLGLVPAVVHANALDTVTGSFVAQEPFGGLIVTSYPCYCTAGAVWQVIIAPPLPPTFATILNVAPASQLFMSHDLYLDDIYALGFYTVGGAVTCLQPGVPCEPFPAEGMITPFVGSSLPTLP